MTLHVIPPPSPPNAEEPQRETTSWTRVDLTDAVAGTDVPAPDLLRRTDNAALLYRGKVHWFQGESESCKTWVAGAAVAQTIEAGGRVLWVDYEDDANTLIARLKALGVTDDKILGHVDYRRPEEPLGDHNQRITGAELEFRDILDGDPYDLAVIDGITEAMLTEGLNLIDNTDIAAFMRRLPRRLADTGAAVVGIDHVTKSAEGRGRYAIGGQHKLAGISGAAYRFDVIKPFARPKGTEPSYGRIELFVTKDRAGHVRANADGDRITTAELTGWPDGGVSIALTPPGGAPTADLALCRRIIEHLRLYEGSSVRAVQDGVEGKDLSIRAALKWMAEDERQWVRIEKVGQAHRHYVTDKGNAEFGDD